VWIDVSQDKQVRGLL